MLDKYVVIIQNSFDEEIPAFCFSSEDEAKEYLKKLYLKELKEVCANEWEYTANIAEDGWSASITTSFTTTVDTTEYKIILAREM